MTYEELIAGSPVVLVEFFAVWCPHCQRMQPIIDQLKEQFAGKAEIAQLDIEKNQEQTQENNVQGTPTFLLYKNGALIWRESGELPESTLQNVINQALGKSIGEN